MYLILGFQRGLGNLFIAQRLGDFEGLGLGII